MTTVTTPVLQNINTNNGQQIVQNPTNYFEMFVGSTIISQMQKLFMQDGFTVRNVVILLMTCSLYEIKNISKDAWNFTKENYQPFFIGLGTACYSACHHTYFKYVNPFLNLANNSNRDHDYVPCYSEESCCENITEYRVEPILEFIEAFVLYLNTTPSAKFVVNDKKVIKIVDCQKNKITENYEKIHLTFKDVNIYLEQTLKITFDTTMSTKKVVGFSGLQPTIVQVVDKSEIISIWQLIDEPQLRVVLKNIQIKLFGVNTKKCPLQNLNLTHFQSQTGSYKNGTTRLTGWNKPDVNSQAWLNPTRSNTNPGVYTAFEDVFIARDQCSPVNVILMIFKHHYPNLSLPEAYVEIIKILTCLQCIDVKIWEQFVDFKKRTLTFLNVELDISGFMDYPEIHEIKKVHTIIPSYDLMFLNIQFHFETTAYSIKIANRGSLLLNELFTEKINFIRKCYPKLNTSSVPTIPEPFLIIGLGSNVLVDEPEQETPLNTAIKQLVFRCSSQLLPTEIHTIFDEWINTVKSTIETASSVQIYSISLNKIVNEVQIPNPEYTQYLERLNPLNPPEEKSKHAETKEAPVVIPKFHFHKFMKMNLPPAEMITKTTVEHKIDVQFINESSKNLDTLYLRERDEKKLNHVISKFHHNKALLASLGLPNKLCILLHGPPGTGKSSAILTIASYLQKNIYYMSFKNIETNEHLQMMFDHVVKNCNKGIIVIEDIDAIGTLCHRRFQEYEIVEADESSSSSQKTDALTLSFFLNLIQGTITPDGLIFIATTNHLDKLDPAFYRAGRFDFKLNMGTCDAYQLHKIYMKFIGRSIPEKYVQLLVDKQLTPATFIFTVKDYINDSFTDDEILNVFLAEN
jgi:hypothetical protein